MSESSPVEDKPWVYIAGPYSQPYPIYNTRKAMELWDRMQNTGLVVPIAPHWTMFQDLVFPKPYAVWRAYDAAILTRCDALFRLNGASTGADDELAQMLRQKRPVFQEQEYDSLIAWASRWKNPIISTTPILP